MLWNAFRGNPTMDLRGVRSLKTKWVQNTSPDVMNSVFPKANFFLGHPVVVRSPKIPPTI